MSTECPIMKYLGQGLAREGHFYNLPFNVGHLIMDNPVLLKYDSSHLGMKIAIVSDLMAL